MTTENLVKSPKARLCRYIRETPFDSFKVKVTAESKNNTTKI